MESTRAERHLSDAFPHRGYPTGWFQVGWSDDLAVGEVKPVEYFGQPLVLYRGEDARTVLLGAHCAHLGAHLGHGGKVDGCEIVCPFHGWQWGPDGGNTWIPSERTRTDRRRLPAYETRESNGIVWAWHDSEGRWPLWDVPAERRGERDYLPVFPHSAHLWAGIRARPQYSLENTVDIDHLVWVHKNRYLPTERNADGVEYPTLKDDGHIMYLVPGDGDLEAIKHGTAEAHGVGIVTADFEVEPERRDRWFPCVIFHNFTPIDEEHCDSFLTVLVEQDVEAGPEDPHVPVGRALKRIEEQVTQAERDMPIWNNMVYLDQPAYTRNEGRTMAALRRWAGKFYPESSPGALDDLAGADATGAGR